MPTLRVDVCDRCSRRHEGTFIPPGWHQFDIIHGDDPDPENAERDPDIESYVLCDDCSSTAITRIRDWVEMSAAPAGTKPARPH